MSSDNLPAKPKFGLLTTLKSLGPAIIVASVVLGPGSILSNSKVGATYGYDMIWVVALATIMMTLNVFLAAFLGISYSKTPLVEIADRLGKPVSILIGLTFFLITSCFQFSNNLAIIDVINILSENIFSPGTNRIFSLVTIILINLGLVWVLYGSKAPYIIIEKLMKIMVGLMLIGFIANLLVVKPSLYKIIGGLVPKLPTSSSASDQFVMLLGLFGTTFSIAGAFYQIYAVREKKWTHDNLRVGLLDSIIGIAVLGTISFVIMVTSATVLQGQQVKSISDVARQLEPLIGAQSRYMFCLGLSSAALSSLLINALIGGTALSDSLGLPASVKDGPVKLFTMIGLFIGMTIAIVINWFQLSSVMLIVSAQAFTVIGVPLIAFAMLYLTIKLPPTRTRNYCLIIALAVMVISLILSSNMILSIISKLSQLKS